MEHFLEGSSLLRLWYFNSEENIVISYSSYLLGLLSEQFLQGNVPLRHLLNGETLFMSWWRSAIKEVNCKWLGPKGSQMKIFFPIRLYKWLLLNNSCLNFEWEHKSCTVEFELVRRVKSTSTVSPQIGRTCIPKKYHPIWNRTIWIYTITYAKNRTVSRYRTNYSIRSNNLDLK